MHFIKEEVHGHFQTQHKRGGGPRPSPNFFPLSVPPPPPLQSTEAAGGVNKGWLLFLLHVLFLFLFLFLVCFI